MRNYPKKVATKQDYINLLAVPEHKPKALADLQTIVDTKDEKVTVATTLKDKTDSDKGYNTKLQNNLNPLWKQKGFSSLQEIKDILLQHK